MEFRRGEKGEFHSDYVRSSFSLSSRSRMICPIHSTLPTHVLGATAQPIQSVNDLSLSVVWLARSLDKPFLLPVPISVRFISLWTHSTLESPDTDSPSTLFLHLPCRPWSTSMTSRSPTFKSSSVPKPQQGSATCLRGLLSLPLLLQPPLKELSLTRPLNLPCRLRPRYCRSRSGTFLCT